MGPFQKLFDQPNNIRKMSAFSLVRLHVISRAALGTTLAAAIAVLSAQLRRAGVVPQVELIAVLTR